MWTHSSAVLLRPYISSRPKDSKRKETKTYDFITTAHKDSLVPTRQVLHCHISLAHEDAFSLERPHWDTICNSARSLKRYTKQARITVADGPSWPQGVTFPASSKKKIDMPVFTVKIPNQPYSLAYRLSTPASKTAETIDPAYPTVLFFHPPWVDSFFL